MPVQFHPTPLEGVILVTSTASEDSRGWFQETYRTSEYRSVGITGFVQDNLSLSDSGVLRGLHFQRGDHAQGKLVQVLTGSCWDVAVDLRPDSATWARWWGVLLTSENRKQLYLPPGLAHGLLSLTDGTLVSYKCTQEYHPPSEAGIRWDDPDLAIDWPRKPSLVSEKDANLPFWKDLWA